MKKKMQVRKVRDPYVGNSNTKAIESITLGFRNMIYKEDSYYTYIVGLPHPEHAHLVITRIQDYCWCSHNVAFKITLNDNSCMYILGSQLISIHVKPSTEEVVRPSGKVEKASRSIVSSVFTVNPLTWYTSKNLQDITNLSEAVVSNNTRSLVREGIIVSKKKSSQDNTKIYKLV